MTISTVKYYYCDLNITANLLATCVSQLTMVDIAYILEIINGNVSPPFVYPISCIESQLLTYNEYVKNISNNLIQSLESQAQPSPSK